MTAILFAVSYLSLAAAQLLLIVAAFRTSFKLGVMAFFVPMYVVSMGNHRLRTSHRRHLAAAWWGALALLIVVVISAPR